MSNDVIRNERGADVCHRVIKAAVENVTGDPAKGFHYADVYCGKPVVLSISENRKMCPDCDKQPPIGNVHPRTINAKGVVLTPKELEECGVTVDESQTARAPKTVRKPKGPKSAVEAKVKNTRKDAVEILVSLDLLEQSADIAAVLVQGAIKAMDQLPVTNFAESKRLIKLQEKLETLLRA